ncbi:MAG: helix-turn-helix domain-containing protein [archaeon]
MTEQTLLSLLQEYGLDERESRVYLYLSKCGESRAGMVAQALSISRGQSYTALKDLQEMGIVYSVPGRPIKFAVVELPKAVDILIETHRAKERSMQKLKRDVLSLWEQTMVAPRAVPQDRFQFLQGVDGIYRRAIESLRQCKSEAMVVSPEASFYFLDRLAVLDELKRLAKQGTKVRLLAEVSPKVEGMLAGLKGVEIRGLLEERIPDLLVVDGVEMILFTKTLNSADSRQVTAIWTNSKAMINTIGHLFEGIWSKAAGHPGTAESQRQHSSIEQISEAGKTTEPYEKEMARWLDLAGFNVKRKTLIRGASGTVHGFALAASLGSSKPILIDVERSNGPLSPMAVIRFFVKEMDVRGHVASTTLLVDPKLNEQASKLAEVYGIRYREIGRTNSE